MSMMNTTICSMKSLQEKTQLEATLSLFSLQWKNASTDKKTLSKKLHDTYSLLGYYKTLTSVLVLSHSQT